MTIRMNKSYRVAFGYAYTVAVKVKRDNPDFWPWELVLEQFKIEYLDGFRDPWRIAAWSEDADKYMMTKYGDAVKHFNTRTEVIKAIKNLIPHFIGKDYSGGKVRDFVFA